MPVFFLRRKFVHFLQEFIHDSRAVGIILVICTAVSLAVANLPFGSAVIHALHLESETLHHWHLPASAMHFINDGLMAVFFFLVGMEIKRELLVGELSSAKKAMLPIAGAIGGMLMPAIIFGLINKGTIFLKGWGIPTATDIAFSLGVASLLGKRFPVSLKIFLTALAIIDDLGAILVIALFYGGSLSLPFLGGSVLVGCLIWWLNKRNVPFGWPQYLLGILMWYLVYNSGLHATIAGVVFAFMVPPRKLGSLEMQLHNSVNFGIIPVFALANTLIVLNGSLVTELGSTLALGILAGLVAGKPLGIVMACRFVVRRRMASLPDGVTWGQLTGSGLLAGIGFTMSIFIATLAFANPMHTDIAKLSIVISALVTILIVFVWFRWLEKRRGRRTRKAAVMQ